MKTYPVPYVCGCGSVFIVTQCDPAPDPDITLCWRCIRKMFRKRR